MDEGFSEERFYDEENSFNEHYYEDSYNIEPNSDIDEILNSLQCECDQKFKKTLTLEGLSAHEYFHILLDNVSDRMKFSKLYENYKKTRLTYHVQFPCITVVFEKKRNDDCCTRKAFRKKTIQNFFDDIYPDFVREKRTIKSVIINEI